MVRRTFRIPNHIYAFLVSVAVANHRSVQRQLIAIILDWAKSVGREIEE